MHSKSKVLSLLQQIKTTALLMGIAPLLVFSNTVQAQTKPSNGSTPSTSDGLAPGKLDNFGSSSRQYSQPSTFLEPDSGSQRFFNQGRESLYFLPEESEDNKLLNLDESIEAEGVKYEDFYDGSDVER